MKKIENITSMNISNAADSGSTQFAAINVRTRYILNALFLLSLFVGLPTLAQAIDKSKGVYRIPYADGTSVRVTNDHNDHSPIGRIDMSGKDSSSKYKIVASADGTVRFIEDSYSKVVDSATGDPCTNNYVWIEHANAEWTKYSHMEKDSTTKVAKIKIGQKVKAGTFLGYEGKVGCAKGNHLHYEVAEMPSTGAKISTIGGFVNDNSGSKRNRIPRICSIPKGIFESGETYKARTVPGNFTPGSKEVSTHGLPDEDYQCQVDQAVSAGYEIEWLDAFDAGNEIYFNVVFRPKAGGNWASYHGMTAADYQAKFTQLGSLGFKLSQIESYKSGNDVRYAAVFKKGSGPAVSAYHGNSQADHQTKFNNLTKDGWSPVNISVVSIQGQLKYSALYEKTSIGSYSAKSFMTLAQYQTEFNANSQAGRQIAYINAYIHNGQPYFSAIWNSQTKGAFIAKHNLTGATYQTQWKSATTAGYLTRNVTGYRVGNATQYAGVWRK